MAKMARDITGYEYWRTVICVNEIGQVYSRDEYTGDTTVYCDAILAVLNWENGQPPSQQEVNDAIERTNKGLLHLLPSKEKDID